MTRSLLAALEAGSDPLDQKVWTLAAVVTALTDLIASGQPITRQRLSRLMAMHFGASDASGAWSLREAYDALEIAEVVALLDGAIDLGNTPAKALAVLNDLLGRLPTQTNRSEQQVDMQQFSTPAPLAYLASLAAAITPGDIVLEPSAGTGLLAVFAKLAGASLLLNERDPVRAGLLAQALNREVARHDAEYIDDLLVPGERPTVVLINPPFARSEGRGRDPHAGARHLRSALARLAPRGRCVAIMSPAFAHDGSGRSGYEAVAALVPPRIEITVQGRPFAKHGTSIQVRLIIYDKGWTGRPDRLTVKCLDDLLPPILSLPPRLSDELPPEPSPDQAKPRITAPAAKAVVRPLFTSGADATAQAPPHYCRRRDGRTTLLQRPGNAAARWRADRHLRALASVADGDPRCQAAPRPAC